MIPYSQANNQKTKWIFCIGIVILILVPYEIVNHLPLHRYTIPFIFGEKRIPFLPWTFIIYISYFVQAVIIIRLIPVKFLPRVTLFALCMVMIGIIIFILFPIEYPRNLYFSANNNITLFRKIDGSGNCFPSLHVSMALFLATCYGLIQKSFIRKFLMWTWTIAVIISVLTTKQHYLIDIFGGIVLVIPFLIVLRKEFLARPAFLPHPPAGRKSQSR